MLGELISGISSYGAAVRIIRENKLWWYFLFPLVIMILLIIGGTELITNFSGWLEGHLLPWLNLGESSDKLVREYSGPLNFLISIALKILFFLLFSTILKYLVLILLSPVLALLSQRVDEIITKKKYPFSPVQFLKDTIRACLISVRNMFIQLGLLLCCSILMMIPLIGWIAPAVIVFINYYFYGFAMIDYTNERYNLNVKASTTFVRKHKGLAVGNGFVFSVIFAIPFAGVIFAPILATVAATIVSVEAHQKN
ncbi:MAG: hypothetical protein K0Q95_1463 [Bacteroidota bacterium]|jgi:CysZ protein|nr:hypothetical protein [Bacteroidota bacterium]